MSRKIGLGRKKRILAVTSLVFLVLLLLVGRAAYLQLFLGGEFRDLAFGQRSATMEFEAERGTIYDRKGRTLATTIRTPSVYANPPYIRDPGSAAARLSPILDMPEGELRELLGREQAFVWIERQIPAEKAERIRELGIAGIGFLDESKRYYPKESLAGHLLGFVGIDNQGLEGVELSYDRELAGTPGQMIAERDTSGEIIPLSTSHNTEPEPGLDLYLTVDELFQLIVEQELERARIEHNARGATGLFLDPRTGEVLALAGSPDFDPNLFSEYSAGERKNRVTSSNFEPGSLFKLVTAMIALEEGLATPVDPFFCSGETVVSGRTFRCWQPGGHGSQDLVDIFKNSCNIGFIELGRRIGDELFVEYLRGLGFGQKTGIDLPGEASGILPRRGGIGPIELATISFGHGVAVTHLQLVQLYSAVANGGRVVTPHIGHKIARDGEALHRLGQEEYGYALSPTTARKLSSMLRETVATGTGSRAEIPGYGVAGKTGTSEIYGADRHISSFIGFLPYDDPRVLGIVTVHEPEDEHFGGVVAAPLFRAIMERALDHLEIDTGSPPPDGGDGDDERILTPYLANRPPGEAVEKLEEHGLDYEVVGEGSLVVAQRPVMGEEIAPGERVTLFVEDRPSTLERFMVAVPNLYGRSVEEAERILEGHHLRLVVAGREGPYDQNPIPGERVAPGSEVRVRFNPN